MTTAATRLLTGIPVLASLDITRTLDFWRRRLGFQVVADHGDYGVVTRDGVEVHFWLTTDPEIPKATSCRATVTGIDALEAEFREAGVLHPNGPMTEQPWGREFAVLDGDGNMVVFMQRP